VVPETAARFDRDHRGSLRIVQSDAPATLSPVQSDAALPAPSEIRKPHRRIQPSNGLIPIELGEIWHYRELLYYFLWRDFKTRYKQTYLGPFWAIFRPLASIILFSVIFGGLAGIDPGSDIPYPLFALGLLPWTYFSSVLTGSASSILNSAGLMSKVYYPRLFAPITATVTPLVDYVLTLSVMSILFVYYQYLPSWHIVFMPFFMLLAALAGLGIGLWFSGVMVRYRDVQYALPFTIQTAMYLTPVIYPASLIPEKYRWLLAFNPMTSVIEGFRWSLFGGTPPNPGILAVSAAVGLVVLAGGLYFFRRTERTIVDML
jgi:lipopolysaccharide transport system permease protein